jgi:hypothetical protein
MNVPLHPQEIRCVILNEINAFREKKQAGMGYAVAKKGDRAFQRI